jgi:alpha-amylase/alpha-mannosidase (GH57 family)
MTPIRWTGSFELAGQDSHWEVRMIYWAQLLHFYQPPTQVPSMLKRICNESYRPLLKVFEEYPNARLTINFNGVLTDMLMDCGHRDIIDGYRKLAERGQIEFTGTGKYHPILPLLPREEVKRQIALNIQTNRRFFGRAYAPQGFFPPEMCYHQDILEPIVKSGCRWIILSGIACPAEWPLDIIYRVEYEKQEMAVFFRDDVLSNRISFQDLRAEEFIGHLKDWQGKRETIYVVTAMDAETYGHHIQGWERTFLAKVYQELEPSPEPPEEVKQAKALAEQHATLLTNDEVATKIRTVTVSQLLDLFARGQTIEPRPSSWSTTADDMKVGNYYPLWQDKNNEVHRLQWEHLSICVEMVNEALRCADNEQSRHSATIARGLLDRAEHSCQMWWASNRPMWDINIVHMGLLDQLRTVVNAYRAINKSGASEETKREYYYRTVAARDIRNKLEDRLFVQ